ncbi:MAG: bifunctional histidinol-phosphatase/imidazoleglycerol-phosphate dehydratase HisB [Pseudomonadota bacterium]
MSAALRVLFVDRDGTIIQEPPDEQIDRLDKLRLVPDVIPALRELLRAGYRLVMVSNQDGLGTPSFPQADFDGPHEFLIELLASQGIRFDETFICPHLPTDGCDCRKPATGLLTRYLARHTLDIAHCAVIGDRETDLALAERLGIAGLRVRGGEDPALPGLTWPQITAHLTSQRRAAEHRRTTRETDIRCTVDLDHDGDTSIATGLGFLDHMLEQVARHGGFSLQLHCEGDLHIDEHHSLEDAALTLGACLREALGPKIGIARYGFVVPMDETLAQVAIDLSGRPHCEVDLPLRRERIGELATELVPHFFQSLAQALGAAIHVKVRGENEHHMVESAFKALGRALRQAVRREGGDLPSTKGAL